MSRSYWLPYLAAIGIVLAGGIHAQPISNDPGSSARSDKAQDKPKADKTPLILEAIQNQLQRLTGAVVTQVDKPKAAEEEDRAKRDLAAQEGMARWAFWMFWAALGSIILTATGVILIWRTLIHTRRAADAAHSAVEEAAKSSEAGKVASEAAKMSAEASIAAERARFHIVIKGESIEEIMRIAKKYEKSDDMPVRGESSVAYLFKNYGKTPGVIKEISHGLVISSEPPIPVYTVSDQLPDADMVESLGVTQVFKFTTSLPVHQIRDAKELLFGRKYVWFFGRLDYRDVFGKPQTHRFYYRYVQLGDRFRFQPYDYNHYNQST